MWYLYSKTFRSPNTKCCIIFINVGLVSLLKGTLSAMNISCKALVRLGVLDYIYYYLRTLILSRAFSLFIALIIVAQYTYTRLDL